MRPLSLTLQAFGSYASELHVDFARLARHGIFSISGPTGAGKSTIFDALVYALYDDLPGFRVDGNVRSQFADASTPTAVALDFVVHGERWRVERRPTQLVRRARGAGPPIERKSTVVLGRVGDDGQLVPGTTVTKKDEVKRSVDALVGLTKAQFEQVVLIPQGRFEEVLKADTSTRAPLLRRLFPVEVFARVTESLRSIALARQGAFDDAKRAHEAVVDRLCDAYEAAIAQLPEEVSSGVAAPDGGPEPDGPIVRGLQVERLAEQLGELVASLGSLDESVAASERRAASARDRLEAGRRVAADWEQWRADLAVAASFGEEEGADVEEGMVLGRARRLSDLRGVLEEWEAVRQALAAAEPELATLVDAVDGAWPSELYGSQWAGAWAAARQDAHEAALLAERLAADARHLGHEAERFDRLVEDARTLGSRASGLGMRRGELDERALKLEAEEQAVVLISDEAQRLRTEASSLDALAQAVSVLEREHQTACLRARALADLAQAETELGCAEVASSKATARAEEARDGWRDGLAGRLAQLLEEGAPCPTCGALEHPAPARFRDDGVDDEALATAEAARDEAARIRADAEQRVAEARGALGALTLTRQVAEVEADLAARRDALSLVREAADRLGAATAEERRRREALLDARAALHADHRALDADAARLEADGAVHASEVSAFIELHGSFASPAGQAETRATLGAEVERVARVLKEVQTCRGAFRLADDVLAPVAMELGVAHPGELRGWVLEPVELEHRSMRLAERRARRDEVRQRLASFEARAAADPDLTDPPHIESLVASAGAAAAAHLSLVERRALLADRVAVLEAGPAELAGAQRAVDAARTAFERARTVADRCAGSGGGPSGLRLSLENWVLADYLRQVLVQANERLDTMTDGRFALELTDGVTDGRKPFGLDLSVFDATTGQVRPATTLSGGETFMAALALALGLADVVSGGSNREVGALFIDEGFGSLDPQSLDAVIDVLRSLEDGGRIVGVISHVRELQQALPAGITVAPSAQGSRASLHYPPA